MLTAPEAIFVLTVTAAIFLMAGADGVIDFLGRSLERVQALFRKRPPQNPPPGERPL